MLRNSAGFKQPFSSGKILLAHDAPVRYGKYNPALAGTGAPGLGPGLNPGRERKLTRQTNLTTKTALHPAQPAELAWYVRRGTRREPVNGRRSGGEGTADTELGGGKNAGREDWGYTRSRQGGGGSDSVFRRPA